MQANPGTYNLFTQAEVNASSATRYASGVSDGNTSGTTRSAANYSTYNFFTQAEVNASSATRYASGVSDGNTSGIMGAGKSRNLWLFHPSRGQCLECEPLCQWGE